MDVKTFQEIDKACADAQRNFKNAEAELATRGKVYKQQHRRYFPQGEWYTQTKTPETFEGQWNLWSPKTDEEKAQILAYTFEKAPKLKKHYDALIAAEEARKTAYEAMGEARKALNQARAEFRPDMDWAKSLPDLRGATNDIIERWQELRSPAATTFQQMGLDTQILGSMQSSLIKFSQYLSHVERDAAKIQKKFEVTEDA